MREVRGHKAKEILALRVEHPEMTQLTMAELLQCNVTYISTVLRRNSGHPGSPLLLTVTQAADYLSVHPNTVRRWSIPHYVIGVRGDRRYRIEDLEAARGVLKVRPGRPSTADRYGRSYPDGQD